jgi:hypothetical protein
MRSSTSILPAVLASVVVCGVAGARTINSNGWEPPANPQQDQTGSMYVVNPASLPVDPSNAAAGFSTALGSVTNFTFSANPSATTHYSTFTLNQGGFSSSTPAISYYSNFTDPAYLAGNLLSQVVITPKGFGTASEFTVEFDYQGYGDGLTSAPAASVTVNGFTFSNTNPAALTDPGSGIFDFVNGVYNPAKSDSVGWTVKSTTGGGGPASAPELDPSSAGAALALMIGGLAVWRGRRTQKAARR